MKDCYVLKFQLKKILLSLLKNSVQYLEIAFKFRVGMDFDIPCPNRKKGLPKLQLYCL